MSSAVVKWRILGVILAVNVKFYSMNKTVKIHQNPADTSEYDAIEMQTVR